MTLIKAGFPGFKNFPGFFDENWLQTNFTNNEWLPAVNIVDTAKGYEIDVAAPGFKKNDFTISVENDMLIIKGKSEFEKEELKKTYTRKEFSSKSFERTFTLPENVEASKIKAKYVDGVLQIGLTKNMKAIKPKKQIMIS